MHKRLIEITYYCLLIMLLSFNGAPASGQDNSGLDLIGSAPVRESVINEKIKKHRRDCFFGLTTKEQEEKNKYTRPSCLLLGEAYQLKGDLDKATLVFSRGCKQKPDEVCRKSDANPSAFENCREILMLHCMRLGALKEKNRDYESAKQHYTRACNNGHEQGCLEKDLKHTSSFLLFWGSLIFLGMAAFILIRTWLSDEDQFQASEKMDNASLTTEEIARHGLILKYSRPLFRRYISPMVANLKVSKQRKDKYKRYLANSGLGNIISVDDFFAFKIFLVLAFPVMYVFLKTDDYPLTWIPAIACLGYFYPDLWVKGKAEARREEILIAMPFAIDLLALSVEAGLDFIAAMSRVIDKATKSALTEEFDIAIKEIRIGASRAEALRNMAWRVNMDQMSSFCATLIAADSVGASIGPILKSLAIEIRQKRSSMVEKKAATATSKLMGPTFAFILPAIMILVFGAVGLQYMYGGK